MEETDKELRALKTIVNALGTLDAAEYDRAMNYLVDRWQYDKRSRSANQPPTPTPGQIICPGGWCTRTLPRPEPGQVIHCGCGQAIHG